MNLKAQRGRIRFCRQIYTADLFFKNEYHIQIQNIL